MPAPELVAIAAVARNGVIGCRGRIPWHLSSDLRRFKRLTLGHTLLMGRTTFASIGRPLPGRRTLVLSRSATEAELGVEVAGTVEEALRRVEGEDRVFVAGGEEVYRAFLPWTRHLLLTWVDAEPEGDARFPEVDWRRWRRVAEARWPAGPRDDHATTFAVYRRRSG